MGNPGRIAFPVILALGAVTGYLTYTFFTNATPETDRVDSPYYKPLPTASGGNVTSAGGSGTNATTTGGTNATTTNATTGSNATTTTTTNATTGGGGAAVSNATTGTNNTTTGTNATTNATNATTTTTGGGGAAGGAATSVSIVSGASSLTDTAFQPNPVQVSVGSTVTWTNDDSQPHTVTSGSNGQPDGKFDSSPNFNPLLNPGQTFSHTFTEAGQYPYYCALHPNMVGTVSVS
jgi:plastocyanin